MVNIGDMTIQGQADILPRNEMNSYSRDMSLGSGTSAITGVGFKPKSVLFFMGASTSGRASWGFDRVSQRQEIHDANAVSAGTYGQSSVYSIYVRGAGEIYTGKVISLDTDGFTIQWEQSGAITGTINIIYMCFK